MIGSLISMVGYWLMLCLLQLWAVIKVFRGSPLLAVAMFFFWPASVLALARFWGDEESDIRIPFFLSLVTVGLMVFMANRAIEKGVDEAAMLFSEDEIAMLREEDPELAMMIEMRRAELMARGELEADEAVVLDASDDLALRLRAAGWEGSTAATPAPAREAPAEAPVARSAEALAIERAYELRSAAVAVGYRFGKVALGSTGATIDLAPGFRFVHRDALARIARLHGMPLGHEVLGWIVHRRMDLAREDAWFVEVRLAQATAAQLEHASRSPPEALAARMERLRWADADAVRRGPMAPAWDAAARALRWSERAPHADAPAEYVALLPAGDGSLRLGLARVTAEREELAERVLRLLASRVRDDGPRASDPVLAAP